MSCRLCKKVCKKANTEPPCSECLPELNVNNALPYRIWSLVRDQRIWVSGGMGAPVSVALNHLALWRLIDEFKAPDRMGIFIKILEVFEHFHEIEMRERAMRNSK